ncbi:MAG: MXAN_5187 C-terminal domain-containing protein [Kofleriaceae bacterium]
MSRTVIGGIVAALIATLTAILFILVSGSLGKPLQREARALIKRAPEQALNNATLNALDTYNKVEILSHDPGIVAAVRTNLPDERNRAANLAFQQFRAKRERDGRAPDLLALVDATGAIVAMDGVANPVAGEFKKNDQVVWRGLALALAQPTLLSEIWNYPGKGVMRVGIGTVVDPEQLDTDGKPKRLGAVVLAYAFTSKAAREQQGILGAHVAYFDAGQVFATSFTRGDNTEDTGMQGALAPVLAKGDLVPTALAKGQAGKFIATGAAGHQFLVSAVRLPRLSLEALPEGYPEATAGVLVLTDAKPGAPETGRAGVLLIVLGVVAGILAIGGIFLATQRILDQVDQVELGVAEIINGNLERTFRPVGDDLDGLSNGLNVMMARLLGRPEPGDEEFDEDGNPIVTGRVEFDEDEPRPAADPDLAALAQEPEPDYYKRVYTEYVDARKASGTPDEVSFEGFIAKLRVNEGRLKAQYQCRAVRFRVVTKDGKVSLKPVPIL